MFEENNSVSVEVAEPQTEVESTSESQVSEDTSVEVAKPQQTAEENARFAEMRRKQEYQDLKSKFNEKETAYSKLDTENQAFKDRVKSVLGNYFEADSLEDMLIMAEAQAKGMEVSDLKARIEAEAQAQAEKNELLDRIQYYEQKEYQELERKGAEMAKADLEELQKLDPSIKNLEQLGDEFVNLRFTKNPLTGDFYSVEEIYNHMKSKIKPLPANSGKIQSTAKETVEPNFLTSEQVDKLTPSDYDRNPKLFDIVRKSMLKW